MSLNNFQLPDNTQRLSIVGSTGSGKTQAALWHLSMRNFHEFPWIVYNTKGDSNIDGIPYAQDLELNEVPTKAGIYISRPLPHEEAATEYQMWEVWKRGEIGVYVDEGYMLGTRNKAFRSLLTQGRSKHVPMIVLSQRPVWLDKFVFSESEYYQIFRLNHRKDRKNVEEFVPANLDRDLPDFHSWYYSVPGRKLVSLRPVPTMDNIYANFAQKFELAEKRLRRVV